MKLGKHLSISLDGPFRRKSSDFNSAPDTFLRAASVLMMGNVRASAADVGPTWCSLGVAQKHISTVERLSRIPANAGRGAHRKIVDAEMNVRCEWARASRAESIICLIEVIEIVGQRVTICPIATESKGFGGKWSFP